MRTFISINLNYDTKRKILEIQEEVKEKVFNLNKRFLDSIKWESKDKFHITLFFLGYVDESRLRIIDSSLAKIEDKLRIGEIDFISYNINAFPKLNSPRVIIIDLNNHDKKVFELTDKINYELKQIGFESDKTFHPHITLGRVRKDHKINLSNLKEGVNFDLKFNAKNFYLMESKMKSKGSEYFIIEEYKL